MTTYSRLLKIILACMLTLANIGCELTPEEKAALDDAVGGDQNPGDSHDYETLKPNCYSQTYRQPEAEISKKVDLLFVLDTSGSLDQEREQIAQGVDAFLSNLPSDVDTNIGVILGHVGNLSGSLYRKDSAQSLVLKSSELSIETIKSQLIHRMRYTAGENVSDGGEAGLYSLNRMLDEDKLSAARAQGLFREDAALVIVFVADENDICAEYPEGITPVRDGDNKEIPAKAKYCSNISPSSVLQKVRLVMEDRPSLVSGIIYHEGSVFPHSGENEIAYGYKETIELSNGAMIDLAGGHFDVGLEGLANLTVKKLSLKTEFPINSSNIDTESFVVKVDNVDVNFLYNEISSIIYLNEDAGRENSEVYIGYCEPPKDVELPAAIISNFRSSNIDAASATLSWDTDIMATGQIEITQVSTGVKLLTSFSPIESLSHSVLVQGLKPDTLYSVKAISIANSKESLSNPINFKTTRSLN